MKEASTIAEKWNNRALVGLLVPLIIEQVLAVTMGAADTVMVSSVGEHAVSAVNIIDNINNLLIIAFTALSTGGAVVVSQYIGRKDYKNSRLASRQLLYSVTAISLVMMLAAVLFRRPTISLIYGAIETDVMDAASIYFLITGLSYPFLAMFNANAALFRSAGNSRITMFIAVVVNAMNIGGNFFFIYIVKIGVMGAALSTLICRIVATVITTVMLNRNSASPISLSGLFKKIEFVWPMIKNILRVGVPSGLESSMFQIGRLLTQRIFTHFGTAAIAANAITGVINSFSFMPGTAYGLTLITIVGQCVGAGDYKEASKQTFKIMKMAYITLFSLSAVIFIFMEPLISLFSLSQEAHDMAGVFVRVHCVSLALVWGMSFALPNALRAAGDARYVMIVATITMWTIRVSFSYLFTFGLGMGPLGVWLAMGADMSVRAVCYFLRWKSGKWQNMQVIT